MCFLVALVVSLNRSFVLSGWRLACSGVFLVVLACFLLFSGGVAFVLAVAVGEREKAPKEAHYPHFNYDNK